MTTKKLRAFLEAKVLEFNQPGFIPFDPISVPHRFTRRQDIEIAGLFAAIFAWGNRTTIIAKATELMQRMNNQPYEFCLQLNDTSRRQLEGFRHRTFTDTDLLYFVEFLHFHYNRSSTLETAFSKWMAPDDTTVAAGLNGFYQYFFSLEHVPQRTRKHIASPGKKSACKRLNMYLRWMVRNDHQGVDFGIWKTIAPAQLVCPLDVHVARVARRFNMLHRPATDWEAALELTNYLRQLDPSDPVKFDFALFPLGAVERF
ncbi:MAG: TIGR02757 family protein [Chitinophagaceae bacterium]|nr:MAG: TIGR02757 family protein [Chitinophagaceae bacterium]